MARRKTNIRKKSGQNRRRLAAGLERLEQRQLLAADVLFADSFESGSNSNDWESAWVEDSQNDWFRSTQRSTDGSVSAEVDGRANNAALTMNQPIDLTAYDSVELTYSWFIESGFDNGEYLALELYDGSSWNEVRRIDGSNGWWWPGPNENTWRDESVTIDSSYLNSDFSLRFVAQVSSSSEDGFVDNVNLTGTLPSTPEVAISDTVVTEGEAATSQFLDTFIASGSGGLADPREFTFGPDGNFYATSKSTDSVLRYNGTTGAFLNEFVAPGSGGLDNPSELVFDANGDLLVLSAQNNKIIRYSGSDGSFDTVLIDGTGGLDRPKDATYLETTNELLISSARTNEILKYDGSTGAFLGTFVSAGDGGLDNPKWQLPTDSGDLLVISQLGDQILKYSATGDFQEVLYSVPAPTASTTILMGIAWGTDGSLLVAEDNDFHSGRVIRLDADSGAFLSEYVPIGSGGLDSPRGITTDGNGNLYVASFNTNEILRYSPVSNASFTVSLSTASDQPVTVDFDTADITAIAGSDYVAGSGTLVFEPGVTSRTTVVQTFDDQSQEDPETFAVTLSNPVGATIPVGQEQGVGTILDDGDVGNPTPTAEFISLGFLPGHSSSGVEAVSPNGEHIIGNSGDEAYRWSRSDGMIHLGTFDADDVSADGSVVVGGDGGNHAYRWENGTLSVVGDLTTIGRTEADPGGTSMSGAHAVSADGSVIVGNTPIDFKGEADSFRIVGTDIQPIGDLPGGAHNSGARDVSADGTVVVGRGETDNGNEAYRWENGEFTPLGDLPGGALESRSWKVSSDGQFIVGHSESAAGNEAFLWSSATGMIGLGHLPGETTDSRARGMNADGSIVVGVANHGQSPELRDAFIWDDVNGMRNLQSVLIAEYGLGDALAGWALVSLAAISDDGLTIAGTGKNPSGVGEAFVVDLDISANESPSADDDAYTTAEDSVLNVASPGVLDGDTDPESDPLSATLVSNAVHGVVALNADGSFTYTPDADYHGPDSFTYRANDGTSDSNLATVNLTVDSVNDAPTADSQTVSVKENTDKWITLSASDIEGDSLTYSMQTGPTSGALSGTAPNLVYTPDAGFAGADSFTFVANDGELDSDAATVTINVAENLAPVANSQAVSVNEDGSLAITLTGSDADDDPITYELVGLPSDGALTGAAPNLTYTPDANFNGVDSFTFRVNDGTDDSAIATVTITVNPVNDAPVADAQAVNTDEDTPLAVTLTGSDVDGDGLSFAIATPPSHGSLSGSGANLTYTPDADYHGLDSFSFVANDGMVDSAEATVSIDVTPVASGPKLSYGIVSGVGSSGWTTVTLGESYTSMVVIATPNYDSSDDPGVTQIRNASGSSFEVRIDAVGGNAFSGIDVHYVVVEEGVYNEAEHGVTMEAVKFTSTVTDENNSWVGEARSYANAYSDPVVVGQVMSNSDPAWSVFWAHDGTRTNPPSSSSLYVGKHVAEDGDTTRADETIGYLVIESGNGTVGETAFAAAVGADSVFGITDAPPYTYSVVGVSNPVAAVASSVGMDGGNGGWPVLYGNAPVASGALQLAIDEDVIGDTERNHTSEQVAYLVFGEPPEAAEPQLRHGIITLDSADGWQPVTLDHTYDSMVVLATPNYDNTSAPASVRIQNAAGNSFQIRVDPAGGGSVSDIDVHYVVVEEGLYHDAGVKMEAVKFDTTAFDRKGSWSGEPRGYGQIYTDPVVVGQVMSYNDSGFSEFWANGGSQGAIPSSTELRVGRHIGEDASRAAVSETIGYLVIESTDGGMIENLPVVAGVGSDIVRGMTNNPSFDYTYPAMDNSKTAIATLAAMDGGDGAWAVLYGTDPITPSGSTLRLAVDEDQLGDSERGHTTEQVAYFIIDPPVDTAFVASDALDVNLNGPIAPRDASLVVNWLNSTQMDEGPSSLDLDDDGVVTPMDTRVVVNYLNEQPLLSALKRTALDSRALDRLLASLEEDEEKDEEENLLEEELLEEELLNLLI